MAAAAIGRSLRRQEDHRLLTGGGRFLEDIDLPGQARAVVLRSSHAHADLDPLDIRTAAEAPGVLTVLTGAGYRDAGYVPLPSRVKVVNKDGSPRADPPRWPLAIDRVRHVGDPIAMVIAETETQARDAVERITVGYAERPAVTDPLAALAREAPQLWDEAPGNLCYDTELGDRAAVEAAFAHAPRITEIDIVNNRVIACSMEPRGAIGALDEAGRFVLYVSSQGVHRLRDPLAEHVLRVARERVRVITPDVGGGFGMKIMMYPEYPLVLWAAKILDRPVKWIAGRAESFVSDAHGRDHRSHAALALDEAGRFLALKVSVVANLGAYPSTFGPGVPAGTGAPLYASLYDFAAAYVEIKAVFTNTVPVDAYRGAGRPESNYAVERLIDKAARDLGLDGAELRRRNFIAPERMPYRTALGYVYDSGEFARNLDDALRNGERAGFEARRTAATARQRLAGIGVASYIHATPGIEGETAGLSIDGAGMVTLLSGGQTNGQGHATTFAQVLSDSLSVPTASVVVVQGDTERIAQGSGTGGSRTLLHGAAAMTDAAAAIIAKGKAMAGAMLEAATADIVFADGAFAIAGTDRRIGLFEVAAHAERAGEPLAATGTASTGRSFPNGCHVCEVEVDPDTGTIEIVRYTVVDDLGTVVNPLLAAGQVHGGTVQGIGQALCEATEFDSRSGQLLSGSFLDYCLPRARDIPPLDASTSGVACRNNPLGIKGAGEVGTIGAPPAVVNAVLDALRPLGVETIDMPMTPERVWRAIRAAKDA